MLLRVLALALAATLTACGGGGISAAASDLPLVQKAADTAVASGLAGIALVHLTAKDTTQALAGRRDVGATTTIHPGDAFLIGSTTKAMTSALAGRLVEQGRIAWTTLAEALPDLAAGMQAAYRVITLEQLLSHRSGLQTGDYALGWMAGNIDGRPVRFHDGEFNGFSSLLVVDAQGRSASFGFTNTQADDGAWTIGLLNQALLDIERALPPTK